MIDKKIAARYAPMMSTGSPTASLTAWAGLGKSSGRANNPIAPVPGDTGQALAYSIATAQSGTPVLLHPEGNVCWQNDHINPLYQGTANMVFQAAAASSQPVLIQPIIWKPKFIRNEKKTLHAEMTQAWKQLQIEAKPFLSLPLRLTRLYRHVLEIRFQNMGFTPSRHLNFLMCKMFCRKSF